MSECSSLPRRRERARLGTNLRYAVAHRRKGRRVVPIPPDGKAPRLKGWQNLRLTEEDLLKYFSNGEGIGILLWEPSDNIVDVDLDARESIAAAPRDQGWPTSWGSLWLRECVAGWEWMGEVAGRRFKPCTANSETSPMTHSRPWSLLTIPHTCSSEADAWCG